MCRSTGNHWGTWYWLHIWQAWRGCNILEPTCYALHTDIRQLPPRDQLGDTLKMGEFTNTVDNRILKSTWFKNLQFFVSSHFLVFLHDSSGFLVYLHDSSAFFVFLLSSSGFLVFLLQDYSGFFFILQDSSGFFRFLYVSSCSGFFVFLQIHQLPFLIYFLHYSFNSKCKLLL